jgi:predicted ATPase/class 3 adenylate cyclase
MADLREWLERHGLGRYADTLAANDVDLDVARLLDDADLEKLGLSLGHRRLFLKAIAALPAAAPAADTPSAPAPTATAQAATPEPAATGSRAAPGPERRQLTVLFCDLADSTRLAAELDAEDLQKLIGDYRRACAQVIERYEGYVAKYMGDGVLAYFGYPQARADAADRAVHAGLGLVRAVVAHVRPRPLAVRVGVATGEVVVGEQIGVDSSREWSVVGDAPNLAARLQTAADPGQVLVADATRRLTRAPIAWSGPHRRSLKGFAEPAAYWLALDEPMAAEAAEVPEAPVSGAATRLVGRRAELALLCDRLELVGSGLGQAVLLVGEAGIGKSTLARALVEVARAGDIAFRQYACSPFHQTSELSPFTARIAREAGIVRADSPDANRRRLSAWLARDGGDAGMDGALFAALLALETPADPSLGDLTPAALRAKTLRSVEAHLLRADRERPALLLLEDVHWMDPSSGDLVDHLIDRLGERRILLLATARPEFEARWARRPNVTALTLTRLGPRDAAALAATVPAAQALPPEIVAELLQRAQGNPLFIEELTRTVADAIADSGVDASDRQHLEQLVHVVPTSLRDLLAERLDHLGPAKETAQAAAVIGQEFDLRLLEAIAGEPARRRADVERLLEAEIVVPRAGDTPTAYAFRHALIQEAAYQSLLKSARREHHRRIAESLERGVVPELAEREPERIAQHYAEAGVAERAIECWHRSGLRAAQRSANMEAIRQLSSALHLLRRQPESPERASRELSLLITLGPTLQATGGWDTLRVREVYADALRLARETGRGADVYPALWGRWLIAHAGGEAEVARELLSELAQLAHAADNPDLLLQLHHAAGSTHCTDGQFQQTLTEVESCIAAYDIGRHRHQAMQYGGHDPCVCTTCIGALARFMLGQSVHALRWNDDALALAHQIEHAPSIAHAHTYRAELFQIRGDVERTLSAANAALAIAEDKGLKHYIGWAKMTRGWAFTLQGNADAGLGELEEGLAGLRKTGVRYHSLHRLGMRAQAYAAAQRHGEAIDAIDEALAAVETTGERWHEAELLRIKASMLTAMPGSHRSAAETLLEQAVAIAAAQGARLWECRARIDLARALSGASRIEAARDVLAPVAGLGDDIDIDERAAALALRARLA